MVVDNLDAVDDQEALGRCRPRALDPLGKRCEAMVRYRAFSSRSRAA